MSGMLVRVALVFGAGIVVARWAGDVIPLWSGMVVATAAIGAFLVFRHRPTVRRIAMLTAVMFLGLVRVSCEKPIPDELLRRVPHLREIEGTVVSYPSFGTSYVTFTLEPDLLPARLRVTWFREAPSFGLVHYRDRVRVVGSAERPEPFDGFDYAAYLARQGVFATMTVGEDGLERTNGEDGSILRSGDRLRQAILARFDGWLAIEESAMARSLLFGDRSALPEGIEEAFSRTGLMHLLAVSGLHLGIFLGGAWWIVRRFGLRPRGAYPVVGLLVLLALWVVGPRVSLVRASLLFGFLALGSVLADFGLILRRSIRPLTGLAAAAIVLLALRPGALYDAGFQLTFSATASILILFGPPYDWSRRVDRLAGSFGVLHAPVRAVLTLAAVTTAAQAGAAPVVAWHFGAIHPLALAANVVVVPLAGIGLWSGFAAMLLSGTWWIRWAILPFSAALIGLKRFVVMLSRVAFSEIGVPRWMAVWLGGVVLFALVAGAYASGGSSWTWNSTSIVFGSAGRFRGGRPPRRT